MRTCRAPERIRGVTLIELLVTLSIAAVILVMGVPAFSDLMARNRITTAVNSLISDLQLTRSEAIKRGTAVQLCTSTDGTTCNGDTDWHEGYILHDPDGGELLRIGAVGDSGVRVTTSTRTTFTYQADGTSGGSTITWKFCDNGNRAAPRALIVSNVGKPRTSDTDASGNALTCP